MVAFVQSASGSATSGSTVTITLGSNTTAGNCLVVASNGNNSAANPTITGITLGGAAGNFAQLVSAGTVNTSADILEIWADPNCTGGQTSVVVTYSSALTVGIVWVYEFSGIVTASPLDKSSTHFTTTQNATFDSGTTATTSQAVELWFGAVCGRSTTITGPASPWINSSQITVSNHDLVAGYQIVSSTGTADYSGSYSPNSFEESAVVTLKGTAAAAPSGQLQPWATVLVPRRRLARAIVQRITGQPPPAAPNREPPLIPQPRPLRRAFVRFITGQPPPAAPNKEPPPGPRPRPPRRAFVQHVTGTYPPAVTLGTANREPFQPSRARRPQRAVTRSIAGTAPPVFRVTRAQQPGLPVVRRPARAVVLSVQPQPVIAVAAVPGGMRDRHPGYLKKRILFGM